MPPCQYDNKLHSFKKGREGTKEVSLGRTSSKPVWRTIVKRLSHKPPDTALEVPSSKHCSHSHRPPQSLYSLCREKYPGKWLLLLCNKKGIAEAQLLPHPRTHSLSLQLENFDIQLSMISPLSRLTPRSLYFDASVISLPGEYFPQLSLLIPKSSIQMPSRLMLYQRRGWGQYGFVPLCLCTRVNSRLILRGPPG
jgi:hypothetical protein